MAFSELKVYSIGIAAENLKLLSADGKSPNRILEVTPIEDSPMLDGEINSDLVDDKVKYQDANGGAFEVKVTTANSVKAVWLPLGSANRFTAPNVRRGERVMLYRYADEDKFYWTTLFDDLKLRKLETVIYAFSGTQDESNQTITPESYYFLEVSTHKGLVHFHTSKKNGEFCSYDLQINPKEGMIRIQDDVGNIFMFDSKEKQISMKNADDCYFEINKKNMTLSVPETYTLKAKNVVEEVGEKINIKAGSSIIEKAGGAVTIEGANVSISKNVALT
jgi:hypothetical protein